jgi:hypothetical protein
MITQRTSSSYQHNMYCSKWRDVLFSLPRKEKRTSEGACICSLVIRTSNDQMELPLLAPCTLDLHSSRTSRNKLLKPLKPQIHAWVRCFILVLYIPNPRPGPHELSLTFLVVSRNACTSCPNATVQMTWFLKAVPRTETRKDEGNHSKENGTRISSNVRTCKLTVTLAERSREPSARKSETQRPNHHDVAAPMVLRTSASASLHSTNQELRCHHHVRYSRSWQRRRKICKSPSPSTRFHTMHCNFTLFEACPEKT